MKRVIVAVTGASGSIYALGVIERLLAAGIHVGLIVSRRGAEVAEWEKINLSRFASTAGIEIFDNDDMFASPASGSARWEAMAVVPCSMGCAGRVAAGVSGDLIARAADVMLKERRRLVMVVRETPLSLIHLRNLTALTEAGAVVLPASPSFYSHPKSVEELCATVIERILAMLGVDSPHYEWGGAEK